MNIRIQDDEAVLCAPSAAQDGTYVISFYTHNLQNSITMSHQNLADLVEQSSKMLKRYGANQKETGND